MRTGEGSFTASVPKSEHNSWGRLVKFLRSVRFLITVLAAALLAFIGFLSLKPILIVDLVSRSDPSPNHQQSVKRIDHLRTLDGPEVAPDGHLVFLTRGQQTPNVIVFFHGSTNSPRQFAALGKIFNDRGYYVFIPRIPHRGNL